MVGSAVVKAKREAAPNRGMKKLWIYGIPGLVLALTVPWAFTGDGGRWWGFPGWAVYSLGASVIYAVIVSWMLGRGWEASAEGPDWWKDEDGAS